jgi:response regulator RpfG family c-di-GMP phosphodiesterase
MKLEGSVSTRTLHYHDSLRPADFVQQVRTAGVAVPHVLIVDDDQAARNLMSVVLGEAGITCGTASDGTEALRIIQNEHFDAVVSDMRMPGMSGLELLAEIRLRFPHMPFVVTTGVEDMKVAVQAMRSGADDYLLKPLSDEALVATLVRGLRRRQLEQQVENYHADLEKMVGERTQQLNHALQQAQRSYEETLRALGAAIDLRDGETAGHSRRVCWYSLEIAHAMHLQQNERGSLARAAYLHDIGKLGVPDSILLKPGPLTDAEWIIMRQHVQLGFDLLKTIPFLADAAEIVLSHHERFDGSGYPNRLRGRAIPLGSRIFAIADALDAITSRRPYRAASSFEVATLTINRGAGSQFDPSIVDLFLKVPMARWQEIAGDSEQVPLLKCGLSHIPVLPEWASGA